MHVDTLPAVYARIENRPGELEHVARVLGEKRINIDAISTETVGSTGFVRVSTHKPQEAVDALRAARIDAHLSRFVYAKPPNHPGELAKLLAELAAAGVNVEAVLTTHDGRVAIHTHDDALAARVLGKL